MSERKAKLNIEQQIQHMKEKGILFNIVKENEARDFLENHTYYFKVRAYAKNFEQYIKGENKGRYINLEFAYLQELSKIDAELRYYIMKVCLDLEHFLKVKLLNDFNNSEDEGYKVIDIFYRENPDMKERIAHKGGNAVCYDLIEKYKDDFAIWNIVEVLSFGDFITLFKLFYRQYPELNEKNICNMLFPIKLLRNGAAHNNCLINSLGKPYKIKIESNLPLNGIVAQLSDDIKRDSRREKMKNPVIHDFVALLYLYDDIIPLDKYKKKRFKELANLFNSRMVEHKDYFEKNDIIKSSYSFAKKIVDYYAEKWV